MRPTGSVPAPPIGCASAFCKAKFIPLLVAIEKGRAEFASSALPLVFYDPVVANLR
jgi:hypothetical protein